MGLKVIFDIAFANSLGMIKSDQNGIESKMETGVAKDSDSDKIRPKWD